MHHERVLHAHGRAVTGIDPLHFPRHQPIGHIAQARAAIFLRRHHPEKAHLAQFIHDGAVEFLVAERLLHPRRQLVIAKGPRRIPDHALVLGELAFQIERVFPVEFGRHYFRYSRLLPLKNPFQAKLSNHWIKRCMAYLRFEMAMISGAVKSLG